MIPGVSYRTTWVGPSVKAPRVGLTVVLVLCDTAATCIKSCSVWCNQNALHTGAVQVKPDTDRLEDPNARGHENHLT